MAISAYYVISQGYKSIKQNTKKSDQFIKRLKKLKNHEKEIHISLKKKVCKFFLRFTLVANEKKSVIKIIEITEGRKL